MDISSLKEIQEAERLAKEKLEQARKASDELAKKTEAQMVIERKEAVDRAKGESKEKVAKAKAEAEAQRSEMMMKAEAECESIRKQADERFAAAVEVAIGRISETHGG